MSLSNNIEIIRDNSESLFFLLAKFYFIFVFSLCSILLYSIIPIFTNPIRHFLIVCCMISLVYSLYKIILPHILKKLYKKTKLFMINSYIVETKSINYFTESYYPYIKYFYMIKNKKYISSNILLDKDSMYNQSYFLQETNQSTKIKNAEQRLKYFLNQKYIYYNPLFSSISYIQVDLSSYRKKYFIFIVFISLLIASLSYLL